MVYESATSVRIARCQRRRKFTVLWWSKLDSLEYSTSSQRRSPVLLSFEWQLMKVGAKPACADSNGSFQPPEPRTTSVIGARDSAWQRTRPAKKKLNYKQGEQRSAAASIHLEEQPATTKASHFSTPSCRVPQSSLHIARIFLRGFLSVSFSNSPLKMPSQPTVVATAAVAAVATGMLGTPRPTALFQCGIMAD